MSAPIFYLMPDAPAPVSPYSHAVEIDGWLFTAGQVANDLAYEPSTLPADIEVQTRMVMENLKRVLESAGARFANVVAARVFLTHYEEDKRKMNAVYAQYFADDKIPARTCVGVSALAGGARVEIDLIACKS